MQISYASCHTVLCFPGWCKHCNEWYFSFWTVPQLNGNTTTFFLWIFVLLAFGENLYVHQSVHRRPQAWDAGSRSRRLPTPSFLWQRDETKWQQWVHRHLFILCHWQKWWQKIPEQSVIYSWNTLNWSNWQLEKKEGKGFQGFLLSTWHGGGLHVHEGTLLHGLTVAEVCLGSEICLWASFFRVNHSGNFQWHPPKWGVSSQKASSLIEKEEGDTDCQVFTQLNRACSEERLFEEEVCVALNKNFIRCCNSSLQLLQSYFRLSSTLTTDHSVRK